MICPKRKISIELMKATGLKHNPFVEISTKEVTPANNFLKDFKEKEKVIEEEVQSLHFA